MSLDTIKPVAERIRLYIDFYDDVTELREDCKTSNPNAEGCAVWTKSKELCYIRVIKSQECLDHEFDHCIHGDFHDRNVNTSCEVRAGG